jgi:ribosomal protein S18 acetylase RimI-like enzyme
MAGIALNLWSTIKGLVGAVYSGAQFVNPLNPQYRDQVFASTGALVAEFKKNPGAFAERAAAELWTALKKSAGSFFVCLKTEEQIRTVCNLGATLIPGGVLAKMMLKIPLSAAEASRAERLIAAAAQRPHFPAAGLENGSLAGSGAATGVRANRFGSLASGETVSTHTIAMRLNGAEQSVRFSNSPLDNMWGNKLSEERAALTDGTHIGRLSYHYDPEKQAIDVGYLEVDPRYRKQGVAEQLWRQIMARHPKTKTVESYFLYTNEEEIHKAIKKGIPCADAVRAAPSFKIREKIGCGNIVHVNCPAPELMDSIKLVVSCH